MTDDEFLARFEAHALPGFTHRDHVRVAFAYARRGGTPAAVKGARRIRALAAGTGKYHETLTVAWARVIARHAADDPALEFAAFLEANPQLLRRDLLNAHYSRERLFSAEARQRFVEPDISPLP